MEELDALLAVQGADSRIDDLLARRASLPELVALKNAHLAVGTGERRLAALEAEAHTAELAIDKLDGEVGILDAKITEDDRRLYGGTVKSKELEALMAAIESLRRRKSAMEDDLLDKLEARDGLVGRMRAVKTELAGAQARKTEAEAAVSALWGEIDAEIATLRDRRAGLVGNISAPLLGLYERIRPYHDGVGAARVDEQCVCTCPLHLLIPRAEVEMLRRSAKRWDRCENCERILIIR